MNIIIFLWTQTDIIGQADGHTIIMINSVPIRLSHRVLIQLESCFISVNFVVALDN